jgi:hypothetical protein
MPEVIMERSIYLATLIGPVFAAIGVGVLINGAVYRIIIAEGVQSPILIYLSGLMVMPAGIALVLAHNVWKSDWRVILTILGWLCAIGGAARIICPQLAMIVGASLYSHPVAPLIVGIAVLVLGLVLSYYGYLEFFDGRSRAPRKRSRR